MNRIPTAAAAALAFLILLFSCYALGRGLGTPQPRGPLFWLISGGFAVQSVAAAVWLVRLIVSGLAAAATADTPVRTRD